MEDAGPYEGMIASLTAQQGAPIYQPHISLGTLESGTPDMSGVVQALSGLILRPLDVGCTDVFTKSLFVRFAPSDAMLAARAQMETMAGFRKGRTFDPQISLCYGQPPAGSIARKEISDMLRQPVRFDRLLSVQITLPLETYADVAACKPIETYEI